ncbi:hypothetical protein ISN45_Aa04g008440 [Arabidopsis thaliana x Arabidopsis arenosa]|uniref:Uncharacterized protein n=1 Tax=Arabidopsis thaliana x Arabidopsis arenosa TaxID=1240361 RepID=A0A8T2A520_9BRAS|nr:hypothetical protein ISN45_Aa04g008440 [Arabidopsis thaliana x Arabidopsis arenosa]
MEDWLSSNQIPEEEKTIYAEDTLIEDAFRRWEQDAYIRLEYNEPRASWEEMKKLLYEEFVEDTGDMRQYNLRVYANPEPGRWILAKPKAIPKKAFIPKPKKEPTPALKEKTESKSTSQVKKKNYVQFRCLNHMLNYTLNHMLNHTLNYSKVKCKLEFLDSVEALVTGVESGRQPGLEPAVYVSDNEDDSQGIPVPSGNEVCTQRRDKFGPHFRSQLTHASLDALRRLCNIPQEIELSLPKPNESPETVREGYCCAYEVYFKGNQTIPPPTVDFLSFFRIVSEGETNWNSFTLQRIHDAGLAIKNSQTRPLDPPPEEKDVSSLNARDKRKILAETKALKDQLSEIGKKKRIAAISKVVDSHGAEIPNDPPVVTATCLFAQESEREVTSSPHTKRKVPDSDTLSNEKLKTVRFSSSLQAPSPSHSVLPSSEPLDPELPLPSDKAIPEEVAELRSEVPPSQGLGVSTQNPSPASISEIGGEEIGDIFRSFQTRAGAFLPPFSVWRPNIRQMYVNRACYLSQAKTFESSSEDMRKTLAANEQRLRIANAERDSARSDALRLKAELEEATALSEEASHKVDFLVKTRAREIAEAEHNPREEIRCFGRQLIQSIVRFVEDEEVWTKLQTDRAELKSYLDLIGELENGRVSFENERREVTAELAVVESELSSASRPTLDLKQFSLVFGESSSQFEIGEGSRQNEDSPEIVGRHKALCDKRQRIGRRRRALDERIRRMEREIHRLESEPHEWERKGLDIVAIIPSCLRRFLRVLDKLSHLSLATGDGSSFVSCSSEFRRFPMLRTEENEEPEAKSIDHSFGLLDLSSDERLSSESCSGSSTSLESCSSLLSFINNNSTKMFEEGNSSENPSDSFKMISDDLPRTSDIEVVKTEATGEPEESRTLGWGTSIQVPIVLIERLSAQDRVKAEEFITKLITRHNELECEKIEIRKRRMELEKRHLDIARELHRLEAHPSDWIEIGLQEYGNMPGCILSIVDLACQGAELFHNPRPF